MHPLQSDIKKYLVDRGWDKLQPADLAKSISIESAELLEVFQWSNPMARELKSNPDKMAEIKKEIADVIIYCLEMANILDFDAEAAVKHKLELISKKYPAELMKKAKRGKAGTDNEYLRIKNDYRRKGLS